MQTLWEVIWNSPLGLSSFCLFPEPSDGLEYRASQKTSGVINPSPGVSPGGKIVSYRQEKKEKKSPKQTPPHTLLSPIASLRAGWAFLEVICLPPPLHWLSFYSTCFFSYELPNSMLSFEPCSYVHEHNTHEGIKSTLIPSTQEAEAGGSLWVQD